MNIQFKSAGQEALFEAVLRNLQRLDYQGELLQKDYTFVDWFEPDNPERVVPAAAFGQTPQSYDSACFAVLLSNGTFGPQLVGECRALGAPYAFEVREDVIINWRVGPEVQAAKELLRITPDQVDQVFQEHQQSWTRSDVLRTKGISFKLGPRQLDFIDLGLIPALEQQISSKLDRLLREILHDAAALLKRERKKLDLQGLYRLIFRFLAGKVLHDRAIAPFSRFNEDTERRAVLEAVAKYYGEQHPVPTDPALQELVASTIWTKLDFRNLSVEVLAYVYENTLVDPATRKSLGTHSTPHSLARYIVHQIPFERLPQSERYTVEPFCGHGIFLVAALQRLRELLPPTMDPKERHRYFVHMLTGFEIDQFALEVSRLCLMLADFPNHNGWQLRGEDIFESQAYKSAARSARVVLSNPPFEDFIAAEKRRYSDLSSVYKPAEFLKRTLSELSPEAMLGLVLPRHFLDGRGYREVRETLVRRFESIDVVALPDGIFENSELESALLIATEPRVKTGLQVAISFTEVSERDRESFLAQYVYTRRDRAAKPLEDARESFNVVRLEEIWERLSARQHLGTTASIHRGIEWQPPFKADRYISTKAKAGFRRGIYRAQNLLAFETPDPVYLCVQPEYRLWSAFDLPWERPKAFVNAARASRGPWTLVASSDASGLLCTQRFHAIWPEPPWTPASIAAILNSPIANAFVFVHEYQRDIRKQTLEALPLPSWGPAQIATADRLVSAYKESVSAPTSIADAERKLLEIDAFVLRGYVLPPRMEREMLDLFHGVRRPVPFHFEGYFPSDFAPTIPLWMYISEDYQKCSARYLLSKVPRITDPVLIEALQEVAE